MVDDNEEPALIVRMGNKPGASLKIKALGLVRTGKNENVIDAIVPVFAECCVTTTQKTPKRSNRSVVIVPSDTSNEIEWHGLYVRGRFTIIKKVWDPTLAHHFFKEFQPS